VPVAESAARPPWPARLCAVDASILFGPTALGRPKERLLPASAGIVRIQREREKCGALSAQPKTVPASSFGKRGGEVHHD
jgi:hypothetical protein